MVDQSKIAKCPHCGSIIVTWNWITEKSDIGSMYSHYHECWECDMLHATAEEVTNGVPYEALKILYKQLKAHQPVSYTKAMKVLYEEKK